jgi:glycine dehydrogenase
MAETPADEPTPERFVDRHIGPRDTCIREMLGALGYDSLDAFCLDVIPDAIRTSRRLNLPPARSEYELLEHLRRIAEQNVVLRSLIGKGYYDCVTPSVIQRNILENPGWYTQYTPYQSEISQGRMEALVNFQTMVADLTGLPLANASLLDEATAAAEAMAMCRTAAGANGTGRFFVADHCHPQTIAVVQTRAESLGIEIEVGPVEAFDQQQRPCFGLLLQSPNTSGTVNDHRELIERAHQHHVLVVVATDLLALALIEPPGAMGADVAVGSAQRFGVPLGFGGPHAAFLATREEYKRQMPGRIIGVSKDKRGRAAYRLALQTREQHIRRDRATSNICTAQVLLAIMASMYAVYHGPEGLRRIARRVHRLSQLLAQGLRRLGHSLVEGEFFDTLRVRLGEHEAARIGQLAVEQGFNFGRYDSSHDLGIALDEKSSEHEVARLFSIFADAKRQPAPELAVLAARVGVGYPTGLARTSEFLTHPVFKSYHAEHEFLRYLHRLQAKDLSLTTSMIPLGSCTMKLNATTEMVPVSWPAFAQIHPFAPREQTRGYDKLFEELEQWLCEVTGFAAASLQPNAGSQGEYAGLLVIRAYLHAQGQKLRDVCLIPASAHGTNPASAVMAGMRVVGVKCDDRGNIDVDDLRQKAAAQRETLAALMITYPSTHGVFEEDVKTICAIIHEFGGQVYMDGANMNAQVGLVRPAELGADVCHLNLHKTFSIPHGGGGPGMGPIAVAPHLAPYLPGHPLRPTDHAHAIGPVAAAPYGSPSILPISWAYIALLGADGLTKATQVALLNANYMAHRLREQFEVVYTGKKGRVAHEFIIDLRPFKRTAQITVDDVAKRLMDYGFHAPTMSFPVAGTMMIEPTESESKEELDRFCEAMIRIRAEIAEIEANQRSSEDNPLCNAPHTAEEIASSEWPHAYTREQAAYPAPWLRQHKYWPPVARVDNAYGDRNLVCTCPLWDG